MPIYACPKNDGGTCGTPDGLSHLAISGGAAVERSSIAGSGSDLALDVSEIHFIRVSDEDVAALIAGDWFAGRDRLNDVGNGVIWYCSPCGDKWVAEAK